MHFFNFICVLAVGILNLVLAVLQKYDSKFSELDTQGWMVTIIITTNTSTNGVYSILILSIELYNKLRKYAQKKNERMRPAERINVRPRVRADDSRLEIENSRIEIRNRHLQSRDPSLRNTNRDLQNTNRHLQDTNRHLAATSERVRKRRAFQISELNPRDVV